MPRVFIALGSNIAGELDCPASQVKHALQAIDKLKKTKIIKQSSLYKTSPIGYINQPDFINAVAEIVTEFTPQHLLEQLLEIEQAFGRERPFANAPRVLDLDILLYDNLICDTKTLTLPHPRMHIRAFVLIPLAEIAPDLSIPNHGNVVKLAAKLLNQGIEKLDEFLTE